MNWIGAVFCAAALAFTPAASALAATTISFTGGSSALDGTDGNIRSFSSGGITVQASAFSYNVNTLEKSYLGWYSSGLGVTNQGEGDGSSSKSHTIDNVGRSDFIALVFSTAVNISLAKLTPYLVSSDPKDNDAFISYASLAGAYTSPNPTALALNNPVFGTLQTNGYNVTGNNTSPYDTSLNSAGKFGNVWVIGAARPNPDSNDDGFKLSQISVTTAVPEPATWAMLLIGFGVIGAGLRRKGQGWKALPPSFVA